MNKYKKIGLLFLILLIASLNFNLILKNLNLVTGGTQGVALIIHYLLKIKPSIIVLIINVLMLIVSYFILSKEATYGTFAATFLYPLCIKLTSFIDINLSDNLIIVYAILAGVICGFTGGFIFKLGYSSGGVNVLVLVIKKYLKLKESISNFIINFIIIICGCLFFSVSKGLYSIIVIFVSSLVINKILKYKK